MTRENTNQTGKVVDLASDGRGIVRQEGLVTFIPFTAQGDVIEYQITQQKKNYASGSLQKVIEPGPERIPPLCPYYGTCGGCQLQHISYQKQLEHKRQWVEDALKRIGKFSDISVPPVVPTHLQWGYRRRVHWCCEKGGKDFNAGYISVDNTSVVSVEVCPIFTEFQDPVLKTVQSICKELQPSDDADGKVTLLKGDDGYIAHFHFKVMPLNSARVLGNCLQNDSCFQGVVATSSKQTLQFGKVTTSCVIEQLSFELTSKTFIQNHPEQSVNIYKRLIEVVVDLNPSRILDLYCGIGISSLLLAKLGSKVTGVELNPESIKLAEANARRNGIEKANFITADVEKVLPPLLKKEQPDLIIVNPPREGLASGVLQQLKMSAAPTLVYISCMPSTLARDMHLLCQQGYRIASVKAFDMFPQTVHVETCVVMHYSKDGAHIVPTAPR